MRPRVNAELDLRPFRKLLSVLGTLRCDAAALPAVLRRMPRSLESLCITAEGSSEPRDFDAGKRSARWRHCSQLNSPCSQLLGTV